MLRPTAEVRSASKYILDQTNMTKNTQQYYIIDWIIQMWITLTIYWLSVEFLIASERFSLLRSSL